MPIKSVCGTCSASVAAPDHLAGKRIRCKGCQGVIAVPMPKSASAATFQPVAERPAQRPARKRVERVEEEDDDRDERSERRPKKKTKSRRSKGGSPAIPLAIIGGVLLVIVVLVTTFVLIRPRGPGGGGGGGGGALGGVEGPNTAVLREFVGSIEALAAAVSQIRDDASLNQAAVSVRAESGKIKRLADTMLSNPKMTQSERQRFIEIEQQSMGKVNQLKSAVEQFKQRAPTIRANQDTITRYDSAWMDLTRSMQSMDQATRSRAQ